MKNVLQTVTKAVRNFTNLILAATIVILLMMTAAVFNQMKIDHSHLQEVRNLNTGIRDVRVGDEVKVVRWSIPTERTVVYTVKNVQGDKITLKTEVLPELQNGLGTVVELRNDPASVLRKTLNYSFVFSRQTIIPG